MKRISDALHDRISSLCTVGDTYANNGDYSTALEKYHEALDLLPESKESWEAATWILAAIGDAHYLSGAFDLAITALTDALRCPAGLGNPFIHLRLGESYFEINELLKAQDELTRAYMGAGREIFDGEDPKYLVCLSSVLKAMPGNSSL